MTEEERQEALEALESEVTRCRRCPRLVAWREEKARDRPPRYRDWDYWARPVPGFGDPAPRLLVVGLAPAAHGANRTGRIFTGDRSGNWLYRGLHRAGFASQPTSTRRGDGLELIDAFVTAPVRCAPPDNRPTPAERANCRDYLEREIALFPSLRVVVALGAYAYAHVMRIFRDRGDPVPSPMPSFGHGLELELKPGLTLLTSYHPSQQNTFTGTLTKEMFDEVWRRARAIVEACHRDDAG